MKHYLGYLIDSLIVSPSLVTLSFAFVLIEKLFFLGSDSPQLNNIRDNIMRMKDLNTDIFYQIFMQVI